MNSSFHPNPRMSTNKNSFSKEKASVLAVFKCFETNVLVRAYYNRVFIIQSASTRVSHGKCGLWVHLLKFQHL
jgi:hypothetical protein